jgi:hypothetical protein
LVTWSKAQLDQMPAFATRWFTVNNDQAQTKTGLSAVLVRVRLQG